VLLPVYEIDRIRESVKCHGPLSRADIHAFARGLSKHSDVQLLLSLFEVVDGDLAARAVSAAYYEGGLSGFGASTLAGIGGDSYVFVVEACQVLAEAVQTCKDATAAKALTEGYKISLSLPMPDHYADELRSALDGARGALAEGEFEALLNADSYNGEYIFAQLLENAMGEHRVAVRRIWQCKQFSPPLEALQILQQVLIARPETAIGAAHVLACFFEQQVDLEKLTSTIAPYSLGDDGAMRLLNLICIEAVRRRDRTLINLLRLIGKALTAGSTIAALERWCDLQLE
jgi:hypothetical protein